MSVDLRAVAEEEYSAYYQNNAQHYPWIEDWGPDGSHANRAEFYFRYLNTSDRILNCGCSNGGLEVELRKRGFTDITSLDIAVIHATLTKEGGGVENVLAANIERLPFRNNEFDVVIAGEILEHVQNLDKAIFECRRVLNRKGRFLFTTPKPPYEGGEQHVRKLYGDELRGLFPKAIIEEGACSWLGCETKPLISCVCIVKNGKLTLEKCLKSVAPIVDEFIVVDTGSTDGTQSIIKKFGKLYEIPFKNYVDTKNEALALASGSYILFMDADEYVIHGLDKIRSYADGGVNAVYGKILEGSCEEPSLEYYRTRIWTNDGQWKFIGPGGVHEVACGPGDTVTDSEIQVFHDHSYKTNELYSDRFESNAVALEGYVKEHPEEPRGWFYLAETYMCLGRRLEGITAHKKYLSLPNISFRDEIWQAWYDIAGAWKEEGEYDKAMEACDGAIAVDGRRAEPYNLKGAMYYNLQEWDKAIQCYEKAGSLPFPDDVVLFIDPREYSVVPYDNLAVCYDKIKKYDKAQICLEKINGVLGVKDPRIVSNLEWVHRKVHMTVFLTLGFTPEPVYGGMLDEIGVGGVETTYIELANEMTKQGHTVFVFSQCNVPHKYDGVFYIPYTQVNEYLGLKPDIMITSRWFDSLYLEEGSKKIIWFQDAYFAEPTMAGVFNRADAIVCSSPWHRQYIAHRYGHGIDAKKISIIPLGIRKELFTQITKKDPMKVIYSSNPDRGLYTLVDMWEEISKGVPGIQLYVYYGWEGLKTWSSEQSWKSSIDRQMQDTHMKLSKFNNVHFTGRLPKKQLAKEMLSSTLCLYPNNFWETFCLTAYETQAAGTPMITTDLGAMKTTLNNECNVLIQQDPFGEAYKVQFIDETISLMNDRPRIARFADACIDTIMNGSTDWGDVAREWQSRLWML